MNVQASYAGDTSIQLVFLFSPSDTNIDSVDVYEVLGEIEVFKKRITVRPGSMVTFIEDKTVSGEYEYVMKVQLTSGQVVESNRIKRQIFIRPSTPKITVEVIDAEDNIIRFDEVVRLL